MTRPRYQTVSAHVTLATCTTSYSVTEPEPVSGSRRKRKQRTRADLLQAALLLLKDKSFSGLSLREVSREAGVVPTAFYRHFASMEELGLALVDESFRTLRQMIRSARSETNPEHVIRSSVEILVRHVHENRLHFLFIAPRAVRRRERASSGDPERDPVVLERARDRPRAVSRISTRGAPKTCR